MRPCIFGLVLWFIAAMSAGAEQPAAPELELHLEDSGLVGITADGTRLTEAALLGRAFAMPGYLARIESTRMDPYGGPHAFRLHQVSFLNPEGGAWEPLCHPGPFGLQMAVALPGSSTADGGYRALPEGRFNFTCTAGAHVKCLRLGYAPGGIGPEAARRTALHVACTRMMRADYCGTGVPHTVAGRKIEVFARHDPPRAPRLGQVEAIWGADGAICLARPRVPERFPLDEILNACPRLAEIPPERCTPALLQSDPEALFLNRS
ncbi:ADYC domain-containing protein [Dinoroseobacter sp. S76]|uniref:ADYC domain-containing protein n=1 Tax=Dinoroseobacter sp. S76 TaxID=3415124 RepID=UPI003C7DCC52